MQFNLQRILKALLFSTSDPITIRDIQAVFTRYHADVDTEPEANASESNTSEHPESSVVTAEDGQGLIGAIIDQVPSLLTATQIREAMEAIAHDLEDSNEVYRLTQSASGYRLTTAPELSEWVRLLRDDPKPIRFSRAVMETLSIIAYRQPVTRAEMEAIRGVSVDGSIQRLLEFELVYVASRADLPGRPLQYATTEKFLDFIGVRTLEELPASDVLSPSQISEWIRQANQQEPITESDVGLPQSEMPADPAPVQATTEMLNS